LRREARLTDQTRVMERSAAGATTMAFRLFGGRLFNLLRLLGESGYPIYEREIGYKAIHRQLIVLIGVYGGLSSHEIVAVSGHEKAQVSRAIKPLEEAGLVQRGRLRGKLSLAPAGEQVYDRIIAIGRARDAELGAGLSDAELKRFLAMTESLTVAAAEIYADERRLSMEAGIIGACANAATPPSWPTGVRPAPPSLLAPRLFSLSAYFKRSAMLVYQRTHGLSQFQWQVLSLIGDHRPMPLAALIALMARDKSQIGRTVGHLEQAGLITRTRPTRRRDIVLEITPEGHTIFDAMFRIAEQREARLMAGHDADDRAFYDAVIARLTANAAAMLEQETGR